VYNRDLILKEARKQLILKSYYQFFLYFWEEVSAEPLVDNWHIKLICDELQEIGERVIRREPKLYDLVINISPATSKSTICTVLFPCFLWAKDPTLKILTGSYAQSLSIDHAIKSRNVIQSQKFKELFTDLQLKDDENNKSSYSNNHLGNRTATSTGSGILGRHFHAQIIDDPTVALASKNDIKKANDWLSVTLSTRKINKEIVPLILVQQRIATDDATAFLLSRGNAVKHISLPAEDNQYTTPEYKKYYKEGLFDPIRLSKNILQQTKIEIGSRGYNTQFLQSPVDLDNGLIKEKWFEIVSLDQFNAHVDNEIELSKNRKDRYILTKPTPHFVIDTATSSDKRNDATALLSYYLFQNRLYVFNVQTAFLNPADLNTWIINQVNKNGYGNGSLIYIESAMTGVALISHLKQTGYRTVDLGKPSKDKIFRVSQTLPELEGGRVVLIHGNYINTFLEELLGFPDYSRDDQVDVLTYAVTINFLKKTKLSYASS
jgi:predicted phage terminase large subunit-like protein